MLGVTERERALVERGADDDARCARVGECDDVVDVGHTAAGDDRDAGTVDDPRDDVRTDAGLLALDVDVGEEDGASAEVLVAGGGLGGVEARALGPAGDDDLAALRVEAYHDALGVFGAHGLDDVGVLDGGGPEDDAVHAPVEQVEGVVGGADAAAVLDLDVDGRQDRFDGGGVDSFALERTVEVDEMERAGAGVDPAFRRFHRVAVARPGAALALDKLDDLAVLHVDGGDDFEGLVAHARGFGDGGESDDASGRTVAGRPRRDTHKPAAYNMMDVVEILLVAGLAVAAFVGFNIGGSSTGVAFGPAVGSNVLTKLGAGVLMTGFAVLGGWTFGRNVVKTMGGKIVPEAMFTLEASVAVLFFVGGALLVSNLSGVPASTSMTAVGAIAGLGAASNTLIWGTMGRIVIWWLVAPVAAFWVCAVIGRYLYPYLDAWFALDQSEGSLLERDGYSVTLAPGATRRELVGSVLVVVIGCYMAFSAGASNVANAVAPLVGSGYLSMNAGILLAGGAIGVGAFTIARRTLDTVGSGLTDLPLLAALIVEVVSASLITFLSYLGIPASLAVSATMCIVGLGWGRATRTVRASDMVRGEGETQVSVNALAAERPEKVPEMGEERPEELTAADLFDPSTTGRVVILWVLTPSIAAVASYLLFSFVPLFT